METEIVGLRQRLTVIDQELDSIAAAHLSKSGREMKLLHSWRYD